MRNLMLPIMLLTLVACNGNTAFDNSTAATCATDTSQCNDNTENFTFDNSIDTITVSTQTALALNNHSSFTAVANGTVTLPAIAVSLNDETIYTRIDGVTWNQTTDADFSETNIAPKKYSKSGMAITGFATHTLPAIGTATFIGKGKGVYGELGANNLLTNYNTVFSTGVAVNFSDTILDFTTTETTFTCVIQNCTLPTDDLNLTATGLGFADNNISGNINKGDLSGTLDAKFYGNADKSAHEFGGTFSLQNASGEGYVGYFGGH